MEVSKSRGAFWIWGILGTIVQGFGRFLLIERAILINSHLGLGYTALQAFCKQSSAAQELLNTGGRGPKDPVIMVVPDGLFMA